MVEVQLIGKFEIENKHLVKRNYEVSITTDCWMDTFINDEKFFSDWICPLEFFYQYLDWEKDFNNGLIHDFEYISDDNGENPIFAFKHINNRWLTYSALTKKSSDFISINEILDFFKSFEEQIFKHVK